MSEEIWKNIEGFPGYQVSSLGHIRSFRDFNGNIVKQSRYLKPRINKDGYYELSLYTVDKQKITKRVHKLVANTFLGEHDGLVVNHINGDKTDNRIENLELVTAAKNSTLASEIGLYKTKPIRIIETGEIFRSIQDCAKAINQHPTDISHYFSGRTSTLRGLNFEFVTDEDYTNYRKNKNPPFLYDYQMDAVKKLNNGSILCGSVGSGKSRTGIFYYFKENGGWIDENGYIPMKDPQDLYIITTAKKRDSCEWSKELAHFLISDNPEMNKYSNKVVIDSWNNIGKYKDVTNAFFLLDEQRVVGNGAWVKSFLKIAKNNKWILLSATPGDSYSDYVPVFLANGFFKNRTEFNREHVVYSRYTKYPKIDRYIGTHRLDRLRDKVLVKMDYHHDIKIYNEDVYCSYDISKYKNTMRNRWNYDDNEPIQQASSLCYILRKIVNSDESRQVRILEIFEDHPKLIIFYSFDYELEILRNIYYGPDVEVAEYNGHKHQPLPSGDRWVYLCQYTSACEGWECIKTNCIVFYSQNYSYKVMQQAAGRIDRLNTPYSDLWYFHLKSRSGIDLAISKALSEKKQFNENKYVKW